MKARESTVDHKKRIAKIVAERTVQRILRLREKMDIHPWEEGGEMSPQERLAQFSLTVDDELFWSQLVTADRQLFHLTPDRIPKRLWQESVALYKRAQEKHLPAEAPPVEAEGEEGMANDVTTG